ncbi:YdcF family protein, partial [Acinetobacter baumannii]|uniref:YdcF family protein n=1 Tax=Acinetobacter baumannii TaxID=470 RepID=UPI00366A6953
SRLEETLEVVKKNHQPIELSGVEAPYMQAWLKARGVDAKLLEKRSMNTCENTRFSSLLLQKKGGAPTVMLVTDEYHMPRTRRLFALNGIETIPVTAPMPTPLTRWQPSTQNYDHSRRANYELLATIRDMLFGSSDCREVP